MFSKIAKFGATLAAAALGTLTFVADAGANLNTHASAFHAYNAGQAELVDYVVCHELAHLRHMNHSAAFWAEVGRQCPGYRGLRERLFATDHLYRSF